MSIESASNRPEASTTVQNIIYEWIDTERRFVQQNLMLANSLNQQNNKNPVQQITSIVAFSQSIAESSQELFSKWAGISSANQVDIADFIQWLGLWLGDIKLEQSDITGDKENITAERPKISAPTNNKLKKNKKKLKSTPKQLFIKELAGILKASVEYKSNHACLSKKQPGQKVLIDVVASGYQKLSIGDLLITPVQRLPRIPLLLNDLVTNHSKLDKTNKNLEIVKHAQVKIQSITATLNDVLMRIPLCIGEMNYQKIAENIINDTFHFTDIDTFCENYIIKDKRETFLNLAKIAEEKNNHQLITVIEQLSDANNIAQKVLIDFKDELKKNIKHYQKIREKKGNIDENNLNNQLAQNALDYIEYLEYEISLSDDSDNYYLSKLKNLLIFADNVAERADKNHSFTSKISKKSSTLQDKINNLIQKFTENPEKTALKINVDILKAKQKELEAKVKSLEKENLDLKQKPQQPEELQQEIQQAKQTLNELNQQISEAEKTLDMLNKQQQEIQENRKQLELLNQQVEDKQAKLDRLNQDIAEQQRTPAPAPAPAPFFRKLLLIKAINKSMQSNDLKLALITKITKVTDGTGTSITMQDIKKIDQLLAGLQKQTSKFGDYLEAYSTRTQGITIAENGFFSWFNHTKSGINTAKELKKIWKRKLTDQLIQQQFADCLIQLINHNTTDTLEVKALKAFKAVLKNSNDHAQTLNNWCEGNYFKHSKKSYIKLYIQENQALQNAQDIQTVLNLVNTDNISNIETKLNLNNP